MSPTPVATPHDRREVVTNVYTYLSATTARNDYTTSFIKIKIVKERETQRGLVLGLSIVLGLLIVCCILLLTWFALVYRPRIERRTRIRIDDEVTAALLSRRGRDSDGESIDEDTLSSRRMSREKSIEGSSTPGSSGSSSSGSSAGASSEPVEFSPSYSALDSDGESEPSLKVNHCIVLALSSIPRITISRWSRLPTRLYFMASRFD